MTRSFRVYAALSWWWLRVTHRDLPCGCHWHPPFGAVAMADCPLHD